MLCFICDYNYICQILMGRKLVYNYRNIVTRMIKFVKKKEDVTYSIFVKVAKEMYFSNFHTHARSWNVSWLRCKHNLQSMFDDIINW